MLAYTQPMFNEMYKPRDIEAAASRQKQIFDDIEGFAAAYGYEPLIVMTCPYMPLKQEIFQPDTKGILESWAWGASVAAVSGAEPADKEILQQHPLIERVISAEEIKQAHPELHDNFKYYLPDFIVSAREGYAFRGYNSHQPRIFMTDIWEERLPIKCSFSADIKHIRDIYQAMKSQLASGKKVLLAVVEGYDTELIPADFKMIDNIDEWYAYRGLDLYLALLTGKPFYETPFAPVYDRTRPKKKDVKFPFGGFFDELTKGSIAEAAKGSAVVSSRSMVTHMAANADIAVECYNRDRTQMGVLLAFKPESFVK